MKISHSFSYLNTFLSGEKIERERYLKLRAQVLRVAAAELASGLNVKGGGPVIFRRIPLITGGR